MFWVFFKTPCARRLRLPRTGRNCRVRHFFPQDSLAQKQEQLLLLPWINLALLRNLPFLKKKSKMGRFCLSSNNRKPLAGFIRGRLANPEQIGEDAGPLLPPAQQPPGAERRRRRSRGCHRATIPRQAPGEGSRERRLEPGGTALRGDGGGGRRWGPGGARRAVPGSAAAWGRPSWTPSGVPVTPPRKFLEGRESLLSRISKGLLDESNR